MKKTLFAAVLASALLAQPVYAIDDPLINEYIAIQKEVNETQCRSMASIGHMAQISALSGQTEKKVLSQANAIVNSMFKRKAWSFQNDKPEVRKEILGLAKTMFAKTKSAVRTLPASERKEMLNNLTKNRIAIIEKAYQTCMDE